MATFVERGELAIRLERLAFIARGRSRFQRIKLFQHPALGRVLVIDGEVHHIEAWQASYHEPLVHLPVSFIPEVRNALVLGGGDLFAARELLKYPTLRRVTIIEHDRAVIDLVSSFYPHAEQVLGDARTDLRIADAGRAVKVSADTRYDLIVNDWRDLSLLSRGTKKNFYRSLEPLLSQGGICTDVLYRHVFDRAAMRRSLRKLHACSRLVLSLVVVPEYPGVLHLQALWGQSRSLDQQSRTIANRYQRQLLRSARPMPFDFYDPRYRAYFLYLPPYIRAAVAAL